MKGSDILKPKTKALTIVDVTIDTAVAKLFENVVSIFDDCGDDQPPSP
ncbi:hypothetical protein THAOC_04043, partial [Thalassiosira oceanica]